jgi:hypothetical protein
VVGECVPETQRVGGDADTDCERTGGAEVPVPAGDEREQGGEPDDMERYHDRGHHRERPPLSRIERRPQRPCTGPYLCDADGRGLHPARPYARDGYKCKSLVITNTSRDQTWPQP